MIGADIVPDPLAHAATLPVAPAYGPDRRSPPPGLLADGAAILAAR